MTGVEAVVRARWWAILARVGVGGVLAVAATSSAGGQEPAAATRGDCAECHDEAEEFATGPHGRAMARVDEALLDASCVTCHGPAAKHMEELTPETITLLPDASACGECHTGSGSQLWMSLPAHRRSGVGCLDCHASGHEDLGGEVLLRGEPFETCGSCHQSAAAAFRLPFAHRDGAEPFACTECHSAHGQTRVGRSSLLGTGGAFSTRAAAGACIECHTELAGPFVFPHPPREVDGCVACHRPHGSPNPRLLDRRLVLQNCLECHADTPAFHDLSRARFRACTSCHPAIHGSNRDPNLFDD